MGALAGGFSLSVAYGFPVVLLIIGAFVAWKTTDKAEASDYEEISPVTGTITLPIIREESS